MAHILGKAGVDFNGVDPSRSEGVRGFVVSCCFLVSLLSFFVMKFKPTTALNASRAVMRTLSENNVGVVDLSLVQRGGVLKSSLERCVRSLYCCCLLFLFCLGCSSDASNDTGVSGSMDMSADDQTVDLKDDSPDVADLVLDMNTSDMAEDMLIDQPKDQPEDQAQVMPVQWVVGQYKGAAQRQVGQTIERWDAHLVLYQQGAVFEGTLSFERQGQRVAYPVKATSSSLEVGPLVCSSGMSCSMIEAQWGVVRFDATQMDNMLVLNDTQQTWSMTLTPNEWKAEPHDGFRPQDDGPWPPCLKINRQMIMLEGTWDGRVTVRPDHQLSQSKQSEEYCYWSNPAPEQFGQSPPSALHCGATTSYENDPTELRWAFVDAVGDEAAQTMKATFVGPAGSQYILDGQLSSEVVWYDGENRRFEARAYQWQGSVLWSRDEMTQRIGTFELKSWGDSIFWDLDRLLQCLDE